MSLQIIIKKKSSYGKTRAEQESNLRKDGFQGMSDAQFEKLRWVEKRTGFKGFLPQDAIEKINMTDGSIVPKKEKKND